MNIFFLFHCFCLIILFYSISFYLFLAAVYYIKWAWWPHMRRFRCRCRATGIPHWSYLRYVHSLTYLFLFPFFFIFCCWVLPEIEASRMLTIFRRCTRECRPARFRSMYERHTRLSLHYFDCFYRWHWIILNYFIILLINYIIPKILLK